MDSVQSIQDIPFYRELSLHGSSYQIQQDQIHIFIGSIENNRSNFNVSGSLSIELWALPNAYLGDGFSGGELLAATSIGELADQYCLTNNAYYLPFTTPSVGTWSLVLMLREWDGYSYVTRDFVNFDIPYISEHKPTVLRSTGDNVITVNFGSSESQVREPLTPKENTISNATVIEKKQRSKSSATKQAHVKKSAAKSRKETKNNESKVSLNKASVHELESVKGLPVKVAKGIHAARPFKQLSDVLAVKGMGPKLLKKITPFIQL